MQIFAGHTKKFDVFIIFALAIIALGVIIYHVRIIFYPCQIEYREAVDFYRLNLMLNGGNLYDTNNMPNYHSQYGFLYLYLNYLLSILFTPSIYLLRTVTALFIISNCLLIFKAIHKLSKDYVISIGGALIYYISSMIPGNVGGFPNAMGEFLFLASTIIPWCYNFSRLSLLSSIVIGILSFYTKIYFLFGIIFISTYLFFFFSQKTALKFFLSWFLLLLLTISFVNFYYPSYIESTIVVSMNDISFSPKWLINQTLFFFSLYFSLTILMIYWLYEKTTIKKNTQFPLFSILTNTTDRKTYFLLCFFLSLVVMIRFAGNAGAFLQYPIQLTLPFFLSYFLSEINSIKLWGNKKLWGNNLIFKKTPFMFILLLNIILLCFYFMDFSLNNTYDREKLEQIIKNSNAPLTSPSLALMVVNNKKPLYDSGQTEYYKYGGKRCEGIFDFYANQLNCKIKEKRFDLILIPDNGTPLINIDIVKQHYKKGDSYKISELGGTRMVNAWYPTHLTK